MRRQGIKVIFAFLLILVGALPAWAAPGKVQVEQTKGSDTTTNIKLIWDFTAGQTLYSSTDGDSWTLVNHTVNGDKATATVTGVKNYSNIYFQVRDSNYSSSNPTTFKRVNVFPPRAHGHANFDDNTDVCKGCHSIHNAKAAKLLKATTIETFCESCHDGSGSKYSVTAGAVIGQNSSESKALGGLFQGSAGSGPWGDAATSAHSVDGSEKLAPGGGSVNLDCTSCHQAHCTTNNYRMLRPNVNGGADNYVEAYAVNTDGNGEHANYKQGLVNFCGGCHTDYLEPKSGPNGNETFRHKVDVQLSLDGQALTTTLPLENSKVSCLTCHYAHGSTAEGDNQSSVDRDNNGHVDANDKSTMMKRRDYMGVCEDCHKK